MCKVFNCKTRRLVQEIESGIFGKCIAHVGTVEFQKRGLSHLHLLVFMSPEDKILSTDLLDRVISAEIPEV